MLPYTKQITAWLKVGYDLLVIAIYKNGKILLDSRVTNMWMIANICRPHQTKNTTSES
jgi:hypothetical protein